ncbi:hypothetical protein JZ751_029770 [Albula glossodonta]|uniref:Uncharacterized protein n=1 Tax=Albula glossodonta TaxID=121402 RepID=A0A8T2NHF2_9TELE|nr:hypothetical protein JZ751_029770 [Albula glossodonta]
MELEREKEELQRRLQESVCQGQEASGTLQPCSSQCDRLRVELEQAICSVTQTEGRGSSCLMGQWRSLATQSWPSLSRCFTLLQEDLEQLKEKHQVEISALKKEKQILEDRIVEQAQKYHEEKKRSESESEFRRHELAEQHLSALARLRRDKDSEIKEIKDSFQRKGRRIDPGTDMRSTGEPLSDSDSECLEREMENTVRLNHSLRAQLLSPSQGTEQLIHRQDIKVE